jgi:hypothetical protein
MLFVRMILVSLVLGSMARADVFSIADLDLLNFTITPASGTSTILPGVNIATFAQALDSAGGFDQGSASGVDVFTATAAFATYSNGLANGIGPNLFGSVESEVGLPNLFNGFASSVGQTVWMGSLEITGATASVSTILDATLGNSQDVFTNGTGLAGTPETIFTLVLLDIQTSPLLFFDSLLSVGPNQQLSSKVTPTLTTSVLLLANTPIRSSPRWMPNRSGLAPLSRPR